MIAVSPFVSNGSRRNSLMAAACAAASTLQRRFAELFAKGKKPKPAMPRPLVELPGAALSIGAGAEQATGVTVLTAQGKSMRKAYAIDEDGALKAVPYDNAFLYSHRTEPVAGIHDMARAIQEMSADTSSILIRGAPIPSLGQGVQRLALHFPEPTLGCPWLMLDFDGVELPDDMSPVDPASMQFLVEKLPTEFHGVTYFYQFSSSAGILRPDGSPMKGGISAHLFFWLSRPCIGTEISAYLRLHCIQTNFLKKTTDSAGRPRIQYGIDESVIKSCVQPHYVSLPNIGPGVVCLLEQTNRQGLVERSRHTVEMPELGPGVTAEAARRHGELHHGWQIENDFRPTRSLSRVPGRGVSVDRYYRGPGADRCTGGQQLVKAVHKEWVDRSGQTQKLIELHLSEERTPGGWFVMQRSPTLAIHHGDHSTQPLLELSVSAYNYVRDELKWFQDVGHVEHDLTADGYLPGFDSFATSRTALVLAPTGSGKTRGFCDYAYSRRSTETIVYAAQTIALTRQMVADLQGREVPVVHYSDFRSTDLIGPGVYVTTNESLKRILEALMTQGANYTLVVDEAHLAVDDFMGSDAKSELFERAMTRSDRTILMTGTLTDLHVKKICECVSRAKGNLTPENFEFHEFRPVRSYPLRWARLSNMGRDIVALMRSHQDMKQRGEPLPRTVILAPTSSLRKFVLLLKEFGLFEDAMVVSRKESTQDEIEAARVSDKAWLVSSPLFAIGLNFEHAPTRLWTSFEHLEVDSCQIIQTVNRANRTSVPCEVRLYAGRLDAEPFRWVSESDQRADIEAFLLGEATVTGVIDPHHQLDRLTYLELRSRHEKNTAKSLYQLKLNDGVQNYTVDDSWADDLLATKADKDLFNLVVKDARSSYDHDVAALVPQYHGESSAILTAELGRQHQRRSQFDNPNLVPKEIADTEKAIIAALAKNDTLAKRNQAAHPAVVRRVFADLPPFLSGQFSHDKTLNGGKAAAEKARAIVKVVDLLQRLKNGEFDGIGFAKKMLQKSARRGVLALATNEGDLIDWNKRLEKMDELHEMPSKASKAQRAELDLALFEEARKFLGRICVVFEKTRGRDGRHRIDPSKPIVPDWQFERMKLALEIQAESLENRPNVSCARPGEPRDSGPAVSLARCRTCVHCDLNDVCSIGRIVQAPWDDIEVPDEDCVDFVALSLRVSRMKIAHYEPGNS